MTEMPRITLLPVGNPDRRALDDLARDLGGTGFGVELAGRRALPQWAFDARRGQFHADALPGVARSVTAEHVLAVTDVDLYAGDLNFVFGIAPPSGEACVISLFRLYLDVDEERFRSRAFEGRDARARPHLRAWPLRRSTLRHVVQQYPGGVRPQSRLLPPVREDAPLGAPSGLKLKPPRRKLKRRPYGPKQNNAVEVCLKFESDVMISSVTPSAKYSCSGSDSRNRESQRQ